MPKNLENELGRQASTPFGCFNHCSRHGTLSLGPLLPSCLKIEMIYVNATGTAFCGKDGRCSTEVPESLAGISPWPRTAVLIQPLGSLGSRRGGNMNKARMGQTGKVMRSPWKCESVLLCVN